MTGPLPDPESEFGARVRRRLAGDLLAWFTTTGNDGTPLPNPVWFVWDGGDSLLVYNRPAAHRLAHVAARPRVAIHLDGNGRGGDIVVLTGTASFEPAAPSASDHSEYLNQYAEHMVRVSGSTEQFARDYPVALRVRIERARGH